MTSMKEQVPSCNGWPTFSAVPNKI